MRSPRSRPYCLTIAALIFLPFLLRGIRSPPRGRRLLLGVELGLRLFQLPLQARNLDQLHHAGVVHQAVAGDALMTSRLARGAATVAEPQLDEGQEEIAAAVAFQHDPVFDRLGHQLHPPDLRSFQPVSHVTPAAFMAASCSAGVETYTGWTPRFLIHCP